jgi:ribosomal protein S6--L-glutamate ligase
MHSPVLAPLVLGWQEWVALPALGLPAIRAKIDTGARTSALHAFDLEPFGHGMIAFKVNPVPRRSDITVVCQARLIDARDITSSNGETERRVVIETELAVADRTWPIEVTLTNRALMRTRMLLGRQALAGELALGGRLLIDPTRVLCQPRLSYRLYRGYRLPKPATGL